MYRIYTHDDYGRKQSDVLSFRKAKDYFFRVIRESPYYSVYVQHLPSNLYILSFDGLAYEEDAIPQFFVDVNFEKSKIFKSFNRALSFFKSEVENNKFKYVYFEYVCVEYGDCEGSYVLAEYNGNFLAGILRKYGKL
jgi:hypothetical protein